MKTRLVLFFITFTLSLYSQKILNDLSFNVGIGVGKPDDRLGKTITGPPGILAYITNKDNYTNDDWYFIYIDKGINLGKDFKLRTGLGYQQHISDYPNYINNIYWDDDTFRTYLVGGYRNNQILIPISLDKKIYLSNLRFGLQISNIVSFKKEIYDSVRKIIGPATYENALIKKKVLFQEIEINPYIKYNYKNIFAMVSIRVFHLKWKDEAIGSVVEKEVESYNPLKVNFTLGYNFIMDKKQEDR